MAIAFVAQQSSISSGTDATSYTATTSYTPTANSLLIVFICVDGQQANTPDSVTGHGVTYTKICGEVLLGATGSLYMYAALAGASPTSTAVTVSDASTYTGGIVMETYVTGAYTTAGVTGAFLQTSATTAGTSTSGAITLSAATNSANRPMSFWVHGASENSTPQTNWTEGGDLNHAAPVRGAEWQYRSDAFDTAAAASWSSSSAYSGLAFEIIELAAGSSTEEFFPVVAA